MSTVPNAFGTALGTSAPAVGFGTFSTAHGTFVKPGGRVAAFVRSTGAQDLDDLFVRDNLVTTINEGLKRCRSGKNDVVFVLPGHTETYSSTGAIWANLVAGAQVIGCGVPGATNNPTITLSHAGASIALNVADVTVAGLNVSSATAALTSALVITGAGCAFACNYVLSTGALGANSFVQVTGAANACLARNHIVVDSTATIVNITDAASTNVLVLDNLIRQSQGTGGGIGITVANTAGISGFAAGNKILTASALAVGAIGSLITVGAGALPTFGTFENYGADSAGGSGLIVPDASGDA